MRRMLFGLLTFGTCATNAAALAEELSAMDDFATSPLRKTIDPQAVSYTHLTLPTILRV